MSANLDLVRSIYAAWERGDFGSAAWADPQLEWVVPDGPSPGRWRGLDAVRESLRDYLKVWSDLRLQTDEYRELDQERVLVLVRYSGRAKSSGLELAQMHTPAANLFCIRDNRVRTFVHYWDRDHALSDLGLTKEAMSRTDLSTYELAVSEHTWEVPERFNIAQAVCDAHPREKLAMIHEHHSGAVREVLWGDLQDTSSRIANVLQSLGVERGDRVAVVLPPTPEAAGVFFATWKLGALLLSMSVLYGDDGIRQRLHDAEPKVLVTDAANATRFATDPGANVLVLTNETLEGVPSSFEPVATLAEDPAQLYYTSGTTGFAKGIVHAHRYILAHEEFRYCHDVRDGERFHGMGEWAWAAGICPLLGPWRMGAVQCVYQREGGFDPHKQLDFLSRHHITNVFATPTAIRSMMSITDARTRYPQRFRIVCSAGEPLNPEAIRWFRDQYGVTVLDYYGLTESYPLCGNFPFMEVREGSMGRPLPGWEVAILDGDENPVPPGERGEICLRARTNPHYPLGYWRLPQESEDVFGGEWFHTKDAASMDEDGYFWYAGRADDVIISAGYRIGPFEVESACIEHPAVAEAAAVAVPDERRGSVVKAFIVLAAGHSASAELAQDIKVFVRDRLSAYAYPRQVEFVADLPKTLTGKIRRVQLRERG